MKPIRLSRRLFSVCASLPLAFSSTAWAYDSAATAGLGQYSFDYQDQSRSVTEDNPGWLLGYVGRFNEYIGFDIRMGGTGETSVPGLKLKPGLFLSPLIRPSFPVNDTVKLYALIGFTSLAVGRTTPTEAEKVIARIGGTVGVGADFYFNDHMAIDFELVSYQHNVDYGPKSDYRNWAGVTQARVSLKSMAVSFKYQF